MNGPRRIVCIHPNAELYGSDRMFLETLRAIREVMPDARLDVHLPEEGPLTLEASRYASRVEHGGLTVLRKASGLGLIRQALALPAAIRTAMKRVKGADLVYISTLVLPADIVASRFTRIPTLIHVHEIPGKFARLVFSMLIKTARAGLIHISEAVKNALSWTGAKDNVVIPNGVEPVKLSDTRKEGGVCNFLLIGRFNGWKGQPLLLDAVAMLDSSRRSRCRVRLVGSVYGDQHHFREAIEAAIRDHGLTDIVEVLPFQPDPAACYDWADIVVVPSLTPEPFGLVAIEGMSGARAVIAADHGGLADIVDHGTTGLLCKPASALALSEAMARYIEEPGLAERHGKAGRDRFSQLYDAEIYRKNIGKLMMQTIGCAKHA